jgi:4-hydroxymandelate oxidase
LCPCGSQRAYHAEGELASARAGASRQTLQILSTVATASVEDVTRAATRPVWQQLYPTSRWDVTEKIVRRAEAAGCPVLVITVDIPAGRNTETQARFKLLDSRTCTNCHAGSTFSSGRKPMFDGVDVKDLRIYNPSFTWESVRRVRAMTRMKILLKGLGTAEDAKIAVEQGVDGIVVSNHGGRAEDGGRPTIECLPEMAEAVRGGIPLLIDGGVRRGTDIFKALALGARAVGIGRPYLWALGAFGQAGVERVLDILRAELELVMAQCGARSIAEIKPSHVLRG